MSEFNLNSATTTDLSGITAYSVDSRTPDEPQDQEESVWDFPDAATNQGYYNIPEIKSALKALSIYVCGQGWSSLTHPEPLKHFRGSGKDTIQTICQNLIIQKKIQGDCFAEVIRDEKDNPINLKPLWAGDMRIVYGRNGLIIRYEQRNKLPSGKPIKFKVNEIFHLSNDRANEIHGTSVVASLKKIIDAKNQALEDEIKIRHRDLALGIAYYDTDDAGKILYANTQIQNAVTKGEMLGLPKDTITISEFPSKSPADRIAWLQYLDNLFYQVIGVPKVVATSEGYSEAGAKVGIFTFDPMYMSEQIELEEAFWDQMGIKIEFNPAPSLSGTLASSEAANTGQTEFQPNDLTLPMNRQ